MKKPAILLLSCILLTSVSWSQNITSKKAVVADSAGIDFISNETDLPFFNSASDAEKIVADITSVLGIEGSFKIKAANVPNVEAKIKHHECFILYNPGFVDKVNAVTKNKWASVFILAHEVGHHVEGHTLIDAKNRVNIELEADQFAGYALCKMGASLQQAQLVMYFISNTQASKTHPGRADRLLAIEKGWDKANLQIKGAAYSSHAALNAMTTPD